MQTCYEMYEAFVFNTWHLISVLCTWDHINTPDLLPVSLLCSHFFFTGVLLILILRVLLLGNKLVKFQFDIVRIAEQYYIVEQYKFYLEWKQWYVI